MMGPPYFYSLYGITLESRIPFPELEPIRPPRHANGKKVFFRTQSFPFSSSLKKGVSFQTLTYWIHPRKEMAVVGSPLVGHFRISFDQRTVDWKMSRRGSPELARFVLRGKVFGLLLSHFSSFIVLHGNVVVLKNRAVCFCGPIGQGKSTLSAGFLNQGGSLLSDDLAAIQKKNRSFVVQPGVPEIRLWPSSIRSLNHLEMEAELLYPETKKKRFVLSRKNDWRSFEKPASLHAVYILSRRKRGKVEIEDIPRREAVMELLRHLYVPVLQKPKILGQLLEMAGGLAETIPIRRLIFPSGFKYLPEIKRTVLKNLDVG